MPRYAPIKVVIAYLPNLPLNKDELSGFFLAEQTFSQAEWYKLQMILFIKLKATAHPKQAAIEMTVLNPCKKKTPEIANKANILA